MTKIQRLNTNNVFDNEVLISESYIYLFRQCAASIYLMFVCWMSRIQKAVHCLLLPCVDVYLKNYCIECPEYVMYVNKIPHKNCGTFGKETVWGYEMSKQERNSGSPSCPRPMRFLSGQRGCGERFMKFFFGF